MASKCLHQPKDDIGPWKFKGNLGFGGFGSVSLWKNENDGREVAVKQILATITAHEERVPRLKERWQNEVEMMKTLKHQNIVAQVDLPEELAGSLSDGPADMPLLALEYCSGGDLRKVLGKAGNVCGLAESHVLHIAADISCAIQYLHAHDIIHRDIKPENIVIKNHEGTAVYKLIDMGYAKSLEGSSYCNSFVGTIYYLAPEQLTREDYTKVVDFWTFGMVVFECATGSRPFTNEAPQRWYKELEATKGREHICATVDKLSNTLNLHDHIVLPTRLSSVFKTELEKWLKLVLDWDPNRRGGPVQPDGQPLCFSLLQDIVSSKTVKVFCPYELRVRTIACEETRRLKPEVSRLTGAAPDDFVLATEQLSSFTPASVLSDSEVVYMLPTKDHAGVAADLTEVDICTDQGRVLLPDTFNTRLLRSPNFVSYNELKTVLSPYYYYCAHVKEMTDYLSKFYTVACKVHRKVARLLTAKQKLVFALGKELYGALELFCKSIKVDIDVVNKGRCPDTDLGLDKLEVEEWEKELDFYSRYRLKMKQSLDSLQDSFNDAKQAEECPISSSVDVITKKIKTLNSRYVQLRQSSRDGQKVSVQDVANIIHSVEEVRDLFQAEGVRQVFRWYRREAEECERRRAEHRALRRQESEWRCHSGCLAQQQARRQVLVWQRVVALARGVSGPYSSVVGGPSDSVDASASGVVSPRAAAASSDSVDASFCVSAASSSGVISPRAAAASSDSVDTSFCVTATSSSGVVSPRAAAASSDSVDASFCFAAASSSGVVSPRAAAAASDSVDTFASGVVSPSVNASSSGTASSSVAAPSSSVSASSSSVAASSSAQDSSGVASASSKLAESSPADSRRRTDTSLHSKSLAAAQSNSYLNGGSVHPSSYSLRSNAVDISTILSASQTARSRLQQFYPE